MVGVEDGKDRGDTKGPNEQDPKWVGHWRQVLTAAYLKYLTCAQCHSGGLLRFQSSVRSTCCFPLYPHTLLPALLVATECAFCVD